MAGTNNGTEQEHDRPLDGAGEIADESLHLSAEDQALLDSMRDADSQVEEAGEAEPAQVAEPAAVVETDDEDDDDEHAAEGQQQGEQQRRPRRVSARKFEKINTDLQQERVNRAKLEERLNLLIGAFGKNGGQQQQDAGPPKDPWQAKIEALGERPDPTEDFVAFGQWQGKLNDILMEQIRDINTTRTRDAAEAQLQRDFQADAQAFQRKNPAFFQSYEFLKSTRIQELALYMYGIDVDASDQASLEQLTPQQQNQIFRAFNEEEKTIVQNARGQNKSPSDLIFRLAKSRGFKPADPAAAPANGNGAAAPAKVPGNLGDAAAALGSGQQAAGVPARRPTASSQPPGAVEKPSVSASIAAIKSGQQAGISLSDGSGGAQAPITGETLLKMSDDDFARLIDNASPEELERLLGN